MPRNINLYSIMFYNIKYCYARHTTDQLVIMLNYIIFGSTEINILKETKFPKHLSFVIHVSFFIVISHTNIANYVCIVAPHFCRYCSKK